MPNIPKNRKITICACTSRPFIDKAEVAETAALLENAGYTVAIVPDLCRKVMDCSPDMPGVASSTIIACYPRAVRSLLDWQGLKPAGTLDIRNYASGELLEQLQVASFSEPVNLHLQVAPTNERTGPEEESFLTKTVDSAKETFLKQTGAFPVETGTDAWYPVIDKERCTECGRCYDFCLFGVYTYENKKVRVAHPQNCKNNCPACARMCPGRAIIFPKYEKSPVNGGTDEEETWSAEEMETMYREKLKMKLKQRRESVSLLKGNGR